MDASDSARQFGLLHEPVTYRGWTHGKAVYYGTLEEQIAIGGGRTSISLSAVIGEASRA